MERNSSTGVRRDDALVTWRSSRESFVPGEQDRLDARARSVYQGFLEGSTWGFCLSSDGEELIFPFVNLPSSKGGEGRDLLSHLLEQCWWKKDCGFTIFSGCRLYFSLTNRCHISPHAAGAGLELFPGRRQHGKVSSRPRALSWLCRDGLSRVGCPNAQLSVHHLLPHAACQAPGSAHRHPQC